MVSKITWSPTAFEDLRAIAAYIGRSRPVAAERFCLCLVCLAESAGTLPLSGPVVPEAQNEHLRELLLPPYRIVYQIHAARGTVEIVTIWHAARGTVRLPHDSPDAR